MGARAAVLPGERRPTNLAAVQPHATPPVTLTVAPGLAR